MSLTPREKIVVQRYLVEGCSLPELRRSLKSSAGRMFPVERIKRIVAKAGRKALFYSNYFEKFSQPIAQLLSQGPPVDNGWFCTYCEASLMPIAGRVEIPLAKHASTCAWRRLAEAAARPHFEA